MTSPRRVSDDVDPDLPGIEQADPALYEHAANRVTDEEQPLAPERDRWTQELPLPTPAPGLGADIVNDVTQIYLNEIGQHLLLSAQEELALARAMTAGDFE